MVRPLFKKENFLWLPFLIRIRLKEALDPAPNTAVAAGCKEMVQLTMMEKNGFMQPINKLKG